LQSEPVTYRPEQRHPHCPIKYRAGIIFLGIKRSERKFDHSLAVSTSYNIPGCITDALEILNAVILHSVKSCKEAPLTESLTLDSFVISACCSTMSPPEKSIATDTPVAPLSKPSVMEMEMIRPDLESRCTWRPNLDRTLSPHNHIPLQ
jgi:hypothetical protein